MGLREQFEKKLRVVIVGAGYIGVEGGAAALMHGSSVTIIDPSGQVWKKFASPETGGHVQRFLEGKGAKFVFEEVKAITQGHGELIVKTSSGEYPADLVLAGVGATLNVELPKASGLEIDPKHGVVVDGSLRTPSDPRVWVAGDIAAFYDVAMDKHWHAEHYLNAKWQGLHAGREMARDAVGGHQPEPYDPCALLFFSDILEAHMVLRGDPQSKPTRIIGDVEKGEYAELYARRGRHPRLRPRVLLRRRQGRSIGRRLRGADAGHGRRLGTSNSRCSVARVSRPSKSHRRRRPSYRLTGLKMRSVFFAPSKRIRNAPSGRSHRVSIPYHPTGVAGSLEADRGEIPPVDDAYRPASRPSP